LTADVVSRETGILVSSSHYGLHSRLFYAPVVKMLDGFSLALLISDLCSANAEWLHAETARGVDKEIPRDQS
jgi:hypothetical protein